MSKMNKKVLIGSFTVLALVSLPTVVAYAQEGETILRKVGFCNSNGASTCTTRIDAYAPNAKELLAKQNIGTCVEEAVDEAQNALDQAIQDRSDDYKTAVESVSTKCSVIRKPMIVAHIAQNYPTNQKTWVYFPGAPAMNGKAATRGVSLLENERVPESVAIEVKLADANATNLTGNLVGLNPNELPTYVPAQRNPAPNERCSSTKELIKGIDAAGVVDKIIVSLSTQADQCGQKAGTNSEKQNFFDKLSETEDTVIPSGETNSTTAGSGA